MSKPHILVFDSGIGGLSIVEQIRLTSPLARISYLADNARFPYGMLEEGQLIERVSTLLTAFVSEFQPDIIVIGCNSASTLVLPVLRQRFDIPVVGVVPAIKPAAGISATNVIGLLATPGTIRRDYTDELISDHANHCEIIRVGSNDLVKAVEAKLRGIAIAPALCNSVMEPFRQHRLWSKLDTIVLACTHFPLAMDELAAAAPEIRHWVDSGKAIARRVSSLLEDTGTAVGRLDGSDSAFFTDVSSVNPALQAHLRHYGFNDYGHWPTKH